MDTDEGDSKCPVCKISLSTKNNDNDIEIQYCNKCRREFYQIKDYDKQTNLEYEDIETLSEDSIEGPILLSLEDKKQDSFETVLKRKYGDYVSVSTELYIPE
jgi:Zn-finger nucleic acid-binding protein